MIHRLAWIFSDDMQGGWGLQIFAVWFVVFLIGLELLVAGLAARKTWVAIAGGILVASVPLDFFTLEWQYPRTKGDLW